MNRIDRADCTGGSIPNPCIFIWDGVYLRPDGGGDAPARLLPPTLSATLPNLCQTLARRPPGPVMVEVDGFRLHGHALGDAGQMLCGFPDTPAAEYRSYARGLDLLTQGRIRLVTHQMLHGQPCPGQMILQGSLDGLQEARLLMAQFRALLPGLLLPPPQAMILELVFAELAANTVRYGTRGSIAVYRDNGGISILAKDHGPGIPLYLLPSSLLVAGYTTSSRSLGAGYPTIIRLSELVTLATGNQGTSVLVRLKSVSTEVG